MKNFKKFDKANYYIAVIFAGGIYPLANLLLAFVLKRLIDAGISDNIDALKSAIYIGLIVCVMLALTVFITELSKDKFIRSFSKKYRAQIFYEIIKTDVNTFDKNSTGVLISSMTNTITTIEEKYIKSYFDFISNSSLLIFSVVGMFLINWKLSLMVLIASLVPLIAMGAFGGSMQTKQNESIMRENSYVAKVKDAFAGFLVIKSFNVENKVSKEFQINNNNRANSQFEMSKINNISISISNFSGYLIFLVAYGLGMFMVINGNVSIGGVTAIVQLVNFVVMPMNKLGLEMNNKKAGLSAVQKVSELLAEMKKRTSYDTQLIKKDDFEDSIQLSNVSFSYPSLSNHSKNTLDDINLKIEKGKKYALVGMSGSGKTTFLNLLMGYYQNNIQGKIYIDEVDVNRINVSSLYKLMNIVQQNVYMFDNTLRYNITLGRSFSVEELNYAIDKSGLRELIDSTDKGLDMVVGEDGNNLSGGQKQRVSIARALIRQTPILLMDEATSSLDQKNTSQIEKAILKISELTAIVITHKLDAKILEQYDAIIFMKEGKISEIGTFKELIEQKGDLYNLSKLAYNI
ncbi:ABC transporter ATP-binding protein [Bombilactobacillus bombi]|uniref:ABC transporter ATP-binding protein n=1 Tax=Bombilactobacillus bombi TaxID=1303590 RepID=UPI0015E5F69F|nr:ABC transporter ATP-binding protein [Bombilactobacillus bombi]MBA1434320.1 ABC transporter ATP-binding protein [Bombilactobacillus bombi]